MANNKKKIRKRFGFKSFGFLSLVLMLSSWFVGISYIAQQTEERVIASLSKQHNVIANSLYLELLSYKRSFFGAQVSTRLRSSDPELNKRVSELVFRADIKHGPLLFNAHNVQLAMAGMNVYIDESQISEDTKELIVRLFDNQQPFSANIVLGYDYRYFYKVSTSSLDYEVADTLLKISKGVAEGVVEAEADIADINFSIDEIVFKQGADRLDLMRNKFLFNMLLELDKSSNFGLKQTLRSPIAMTDDASYAGLTINMEQLQLRELFSVINRYENRYNLDQQIEWTLEVSSQNQEGQDRLHELYSRQSEVLLPSANTLMSQLFHNSAQDISYLRKVEHQDTDMAYNYSK